MSIESKLILVAEEVAERVVTKEAIRQAIIAKGTSVPAGTALHDFPTKISEITTSGILPATVEAIFNDINGEIIAGDYVTKSDAVAASKEAIRLAIIDKGIATPIDTHLQDYPAKIGEIVTGIPESIINPILDGINGEVIAGNYVAKSDAIAASKEAVRLAIVAKGVAVPVETELDVYATKIAAIQPPVTSAVKVTYIDPEGTIIKEESGPVGFASTPPDIDTLKKYYYEDGTTILATPSGWIGNYTNVTEDRVVGCRYIQYTNDTHVFIHLDAITMPGLLTPVFWINNKETAKTIRCYFGDGEYQDIYFEANGIYGFTHTYATYGDYRVTFIDSDGEFRLGSVNTSYYFMDSNYGKCLTGIILGTHCYTTTDNAFTYCSSLSYIIFSGSGGTKNIGIMSNFHSLKAIIVPGGYGKSSPLPFQYQDNLRYIVWDVAGSSINGVGLYYLKSLECFHLTYPASTTTLQYQSPNKSIRHIVVPEGITLIEQNCFQSNDALLSVKLPSTITGIKDGAFNSTALTVLDIPASVTTMNSGPITNSAKALRSIIVRATTPPTLAAGTYQFLPITNIPSDYKIYVPDASVNTYKAAAGWSQYASKIFALSTYVP